MTMQAYWWIEGYSALPGILEPKEAAGSEPGEWRKGQHAARENQIDFDTAKAVLGSLRWRADTVVTNHFGDRTWLRECFSAEGQRIGITDCCLEDDPCEWHRVFTGAETAANLRRKWTTSTSSRS